MRWVWKVSRATGRSGERLVDVTAGVRGPAELIAWEGPDGIFLEASAAAGSVSGS